MKTGWVPRFGGVVRAITGSFWSSRATAIQRSVALAFMVGAVLVVSCGTADDPAGDDEAVASVTSALCAQAKLTVSPASPVPPGVAATLTATATCAQGDADQFQFSQIRVGTDTTWQVVRPYAPGTLGANNVRTSTYTLPVSPASLPSGQYRFRVDIRRGSGPIEATATANAMVGNVCHGLTATTQSGDPPPLGTAITLGAQATCSGQGVLPEYQLDYQSTAPGSPVALLPPDWSLDAERTWGTEAGLTSGRYFIVTRSRAAGNTSTGEAIVRQSYLLGDVCPDITLTPPWEEQPVLDGALRLTASSRCLRTAQPRYQFLYRLEGVSGAAFVPINTEWGAA